VLPERWPSCGGGRLAVLDYLTMKPKGPLRVLSPLAEWWNRHYGFSDPGVDFREGGPGR